MLTDTPKKPLQGIHVAVFESRHAEIMRAGFEKHGASVFTAPTLKEIPLAENADALRFGESLIMGEVDVLVLMTGVGTRMLVKTLETQHEKDEIVSAFKKTVLVARGPKPVQALKELELQADIVVPEPNTWREILNEIDRSSAGVEIENKLVAVQEYGVSQEDFLRELKKRRARVLRVPVYRWALPDNTDPIKSIIEKTIAGEVHVAVFTSTIQVRHILQVASEIGKEESFREALKKVLIASIGPITSETLLAEGFPHDFEPSHPKMGTLMKELADQAEKLIPSKTMGAITGVTCNQKETNQAEPCQSDFLKACRGEAVSRRPIWLMRQAGRYQESYRRIRGKVSFLELCKNKEMVAEVTLNAVQELGVDAAIIFSDILVIAEPLGFKLDYVEGGGPVLKGDVSTAAAIDRLPEIDPSQSLSYVWDALELTRSRLDPKIPLIGFSGAPFTLASYMLEGGASRNFIETKKLMYSDSQAWHALMSKISRGLVLYLQGQVEAGADALQIFDSWVGCLNGEDYEKYVMPHTQFIFERLKGSVPLIHFGTGTGPFISKIARAGGDVVGIDAHFDMEEAAEILGDKVVLQGNFDPVKLFAPKSVIKAEAEKILSKMNGRKGFIFNLGHGILPKTPEDHVKYLVDVVHDFPIS